MTYPSCYLLCWAASGTLGDPSNPLAQACHYLGSTDRDVLERFAEHLAGNGACITRAAVNAGFKLQISRIWLGGDRHLERYLKSRKNNRLLCPFCNPKIKNES